MRVGILLYNYIVVGFVKFEMDPDRYNFDNILHSGNLVSYLFYPRPEVNPCRSDDYNYYPYDKRIPWKVHQNHGLALANRIWLSRKYKDYTYYELTDGTVVYTTNYTLMSSFYNLYGYNQWTHSDTTRVLELQEIKNRNDNISIFSLDFCSEFMFYILCWFIENFYIICFIILLLFLSFYGINYVAKEFEFIIRRKIN